MKALRLVVRFWLRLLGVTALVFVVLYTTPGSLRARVVSDREDGQILRRTGTRQTVNRGSLLFGGDCIESGATATAIIYESEPDLVVHVPAGRQHCIGTMSAMSAAYGRWLTRAARGDLGYYYGTPVITRLTTHAARTMLLVAGALVLSLAAALMMVVADLRWSGHRIVNFFVQVVGVLSGLHVIVLCFGVIALQWAAPNSGFSVWLIVILALGNGTLIDYYHVLREQIRNALHRDYVEAARGRGANPLKHAVRYEITLGLIDATSSRIPALVGGTIVIEWVFSYLGLGYDIVKAIESRDFELIMGVTTVVALVLICVLEASSLAHRSLDPRLAGS